MVTQGMSLCALVLSVSAVVFCFVLYVNQEDSNPNRSLQTQLDELDSQMKAILKMRSVPSGKNTEDDIKAGYTNEWQDCQGVLNLNKSAVSGVYTLHSTNSTGLELLVYCDMTTHGGGWIVFQRRQDGSEDFYRGWEDYKAGFGKLDGEFWFGLDNIHMLVSDHDDWQLLVNMRFTGQEKYALYESFSIGPETLSYVLNVGNYSGDAGDSLTERHNGMSFTTKDRDNDRYSNNCAINYTGAWWYNNCHESNLNGVYGGLRNTGPNWRSFSTWNPVEFAEMKMKRKM